MEYTSEIVTKSEEESIEEFVKKVDETVNKKITEGWMLMQAPDYTETNEQMNCICHFIRQIIAQEDPRQFVDVRQAAEEFSKKYAKLDSKLTDLLEINGIVIYLKDGQLYTATKEKETAGVNGREIYEYLRNSKHCPADLDKDWVIQQIEGLL